MNGISDHVNSTPESLDMGGAPPRTDALIGPAACGRCPNPDSLKRRASARALSLEHGLNISWISELSGTPRSYASRLRNCALQRAPVRWTLTSEPTIGRSLRPCQSRNITEQRIQWLQRRAFPVTSRSSFKSPHESNRRSTNRPRDKRNRATEGARWTHAGKRNQKATACLKQRKQVSSLFLIELVNMIWMQ